MNAKNINQCAMDAAQQEISLLVNAISCDPRFDVQHQISLERGYFFIDIWRENIHHAYLSNANMSPGEDYLISKLQSTVNKLREICREYKIDTQSKPVISSANRLAKAAVSTKFTTQSGVLFDFSNIRGEVFNINDIAHELASIGVTQSNGSVITLAQISVVSSQVKGAENALGSLLRFSPVAYCGYVRPQLSQILPTYQSAFNAIGETLYSTLGLKWLEYDHHSNIPDLPFILNICDHAESARLFLNRYYTLQSLAVANASNG